MPKNSNRRGHARAASPLGRQPAPRDGFVNIGPALVCSPITRFFGRPYPIQFRSQGALDAWTHALGHTGLWPVWQDPGTLCWQIRQEILRQLECVHPSSSAAGQISADDRQRLAFQVSTNLKYHLSEGTVIEATPTLETLLANSDVDLSLPMSMVAPPYRAQYLRFGEAAMRYLKVPAPQSPDHVFAGAFCFLTRHGMSGEPEGKCWTLELVFIGKRQDRYAGHISLLGETDRGGRYGRRVVGRSPRRLHRSRPERTPFIDARRGQLRGTPVPLHGPEAGTCDTAQRIRRGVGPRRRPGGAQARQTVAEIGLPLQRHPGRPRVIAAGGFGRCRGRRRGAPLAPWTFSYAALRGRQPAAQTHLRRAGPDSRGAVAA